MELVALIGALSAGLIALISSIFVNIRHSRCTKLKCCGCECTREIMTLDELKLEQKSNEITQANSLATTI
jgi:hypothetical protein